MRKGRIPKMQGEERFIQERPGRVECHGRIIEIDHREVFHGKLHKLLNALFRGEPYQFAHQTVEYTIRLENITDDFPTEIAEFCLFGSYLGRLQVGDEVMVRGKKQGDRCIAKAIYNRTTEMEIRSGLQIPAWVIRSAGAAVSAIGIALIMEVVWFFKSGAFTAGITALMTSLMPLIIVCICICLLIRSIVPKRRR